MKKIYAIVPALVATLYSCGDQAPREIKATDRSISRAVAAFEEGDMEHYISWAHKAKLYADKASDSSQFSENAKKRAYIADLMPKALEEPEAAINLVWKSCSYGFKDLGRAFINAESITNYLYIEPESNLSEDNKKAWYSKRDELKATLSESVMLFYERYKNFIATQDLKTKVVDLTYGSAIINCSLDTNVVKGKEFEVYMSRDAGRWQIEDFSTNYFLGTQSSADPDSGKGFERNIEILSNYISAKHVSMEDLITMLKGRPITDALADMVSELKNMPKEQFDNNPLKGNFVTLLDMIKPNGSIPGLPLGEELYVVEQKAENGDMYITVKTKENGDGLITLPLSQVHVAIEPTKPD